MEQKYTQNWKAYNKAQCKEKALFMEMLAELCHHIKQPGYKFGRPMLYLADILYCLVYKIYCLYSARRFTSDMEIAKEKGYISKVPHFNSIYNYLQKEDTTAILMKMIEISSLPLKSLETQFAADSSGFGTSRFGRWFDFKHGRDAKYRIWVKAHIMIGVKSNIVTSVILTEGKAGDSVYFKPLLKDTAKNFTIGCVCADKAYSSKSNIEAINKAGGTPFIPFKSNTARTSHNYKGLNLWKKSWVFFEYNKEEFYRNYHKRSNVETTFHMIKTKFGDSVRSRKKTGQFNEVLCKVLCHNISVVIQEMFEIKETAKKFQ